MWYRGVSVLSAKWTTIPGWKNNIVGSQLNSLQIYSIFLFPTGRKIKNKMCETGVLVLNWILEWKSSPLQYSQIHFKIYSDFLLPMHWSKNSQCETVVYCKVKTIKRMAPKTVQQVHKSNSLQKLLNFFIPNMSKNYLKGMRQRGKILANWRTTLWKNSSLSFQLSVTLYFKIQNFLSTLKNFHWLAYSKLGVLNSKKIRKNQPLEESSKFRTKFISDPECKLNSMSFPVFPSIFRELNYEI